MGRKVHPIGFRLNINKPWDGRWYADGDDYVDQLHQDLEIRKLIHAQTGNAGVSRVEVERFPGKVKVVVNTAKPGILIGRKGESVKIIRKQLEELTGKKCDLEIKEIKNPDLDAYLVGMNRNVATPFAPAGSDHSPFSSPSNPVILSMLICIS